MTAKKRLWIWVGAFVLALGLGVGLYFFSWTFRSIVDEARLRIGSSRLRFEAKPEHVVIPGERTLAADRYAGIATRPFVIIVHPSDPDGRRSPVCRALAERLQHAGFGVLALDLPGFGTSPKPPLPLPEDFAFAPAVAASARHALDRGWARPGRIVYLGYSLGGGVVMRAAALDPRPAAVVSLGPTPGGPAWADRHARPRLRDMRILPALQSVNAMRRCLERLDPVRALRSGELPPTLFIFGEEESQPEGLRGAVEASSGRSRIQVIPGTGHAYGVWREPDREVFFDEEPLRLLTETVIGFLERLPNDPPPRRG